MPKMLVSKGDKRPLPNAKGSYSGGLGWDNDVDLDCWIFRYWDAAHGNKVEAIYWGNEDWQSKTLFNSQGQPYVITPEGDVTYKGDDRHGTESEQEANKQAPDGGKGYDEKVDFELGKTPDGVIKYEFWATNYKDPQKPGPDPILGEASGIVCGLKDNASSNEIQAPLGTTNAWDVSAHVCTIDVIAGTMINVGEGTAEDMFTVAGKKGVKFDD